MRLLESKVIHKRLIEFGLAAVTVASSLFCWFVGSQHMGSPVTSIYLAEIVLLGLLGFLSIAINSPPSSGLIPWGISGIFAVFVVLGGFSIGPLLIPAVISMTVASILADRRTNRSSAFGILIFIFAGLIQLTIMLFLFWGRRSI
jgi:hypothetical protein